MGMTKREIENVGIGGGIGGDTRLDGSDVASLGKNNTITLRHVWPDDTDARVWHAVKSAFMNMARGIAKATGKSVEVYSKHGFMIAQVEPRD